MDSRPRPRYLAIVAATVGAVLIVLGFAARPAVENDPNVHFAPWILMILGLIALANGVGALVRAGEDYPRRRRPLPSRPVEPTPPAEPAAE